MCAVPECPSAFEALIEELHICHTSLATVAVSHINRRKQVLLHGIRQNSDMEKVSEYVQTLSCKARARYITKVLNTGLSIDPYSISNELWQKELDALPRT